MEDPAAQQYPHSVGVDFRKLKRASLEKIIKQYGYEPKADATQPELALYAARLFESSAVSEDAVLHTFAQRFCYSGADPNAGASKARQRARDVGGRQPAVQGEQVAAKIPDPEEGASPWILANVVDYHPLTQNYTVQDADESRVLDLPFSDVRRLEDTSAHLRRGDKVLAVYPETTSFYYATIVKHPKPPVHASALWEVVVRFQDDFDEEGRSIAARRVPARFVLSLQGVEEEESDEDEEQ